ncbi:MAG: glycoside hydrolase family 3 N-terminal domain-containing protein [Acidobacteriota bacterium]
MLRQYRTFAIALTLFLIAGLCMVSLIAARAKGHERYNRPLSRKDEAWVRKTLAALTIEEKVGQMVMADANVVFWNRENPDYQKMRHHLVDNKVGGVLLFRSEVWPASILANRWQQMAKVPLLMAADLEMGMGMRFDDTPWWVPNMAVAATGDPQLARQQGEATAIQSRAMGLNWIYAPSADVNNNPENPVINTRSFGEDPAQVSTFVRAFVEGVQDAGALACAKHFPGHGDTATDSHIGLPVVDVSRERLLNLELVPFRAAVESRVGSIMSAHIALPQIDPTPAAPVRQLSEKDAARAEFVSQTEVAGQVTVPGTLSPRILTGLLREELRFEGIVVTDAMNMAGVAARYTPGEAAVQAVLAGADMVIKSADTDAAVAGLREAVRNGQLSVARIDPSVTKILRAKARLGLHRQRLIDLEQVDQTINAPRFNDLARQIAERSMTLVRDRSQSLSSFRARTGRRTVLNLTLIDDVDRAVTQPFVDELQQQGLEVENILIDSKAGEAELAALFERIDRSPADLITYSIPVRARSGKGSVALPPVGKRVADELARRPRPQIVISFGNPYLLLAMPETPAYLIAWSPFQVSLRAAARAVSGAIPIGGRLPISLPGLYARGQGIQLAQGR